MINSILLVGQIAPPQAVSKVIRILNSGRCSATTLIKTCDPEISIRFLHARTLADPKALANAIKNAEPGFPLRKQATYNMGYIEEARVKSALLYGASWKELVKDVTTVDSYRYVYEPSSSKRFLRSGARIIKKLASNMSIALYIRGSSNKPRILEIEYSSL